MKHMLSLVAGILFCAAAFSQSYRFNGDWSGTITIPENDQELFVRIQVQGSQITQYFYDEETGDWSPVSPVLARYEANKNNFLYFWMNNSSVWSETQTFGLSYVNNDKLYVVWSRQVNNIKAGEDYDTWSLQGSGYLTRR